MYKYVPIKNLRRQLRIRRLISRICALAVLVLLVGILALWVVLIITEPREAIAETISESQVDAVKDQDDPAEIALESETEIESESESESVAETDPDMEYAGTFTLTAYCNCAICCGKWAGGPTASGAMPEAGRTIAVDKRVIPLGAKVYIDGFGEFIAEDTGSAIKGNRIDIYMDSHEAARWFAGGEGSCRREVWIIK